jgi:small subunit ribosomal protein S6
LLLYPCLPADQGRPIEPVYGSSDQREEVTDVRLYELTVILVSELEDHKVATEEIAEVARGLGAEVEKIDFWGKKRFAYPIKKQMEGFYSMITMKAPADQIQELDRLLSLRSQILRHLVVSMDEE